MTSTPITPMMNRRQRIILIAVLIFGVIPAALALLLLLSGFPYAVTGALVYFYVLVIAGVTILLFEQLWKEVRGPKQSPY
ncbi:MAG TPA: hypothetical protein VFE98_05205 [Candidatus Bathyarchaeia archaeon]|nr:hypothetical protein [Candidatus Bathyarchaeia archaeon]